MTTSVIRLALTTLAFGAALVGCAPMDKKSAIRDTVQKEPDASFLKRVKNDPFPAAGQAPQSAAAPAPTPGSPVELNTSVGPVRSGMRTGVLGQPNVTVGGGGNPPLKALNAGDDTATAIASDSEPAGATDGTSSNETATKPITARNTNIRPLKRPQYGAMRRN